MSDLCAYEPCKCFVPADELFYSDICAILGAKAVNRVSVSPDVPLKRDDKVVPRCVCGHSSCGDSLSGRIN